jgi:hypothetical protein
MNQDELTDLGFTLAEIVRGVVRGSLGGEDKHVVEALRHFLLGSTGRSPDDYELIANEAVRQISIPAPDKSELRNPRKEVLHRAIHQAVRYYLEHSTKDRNASMRMGKAEDGFLSEVKKLTRMLEEQDREREATLAKLRKRIEPI